MPGSMREVAHAEEEGVEFVWLSAPEAFLGDGAPEVTGRCARASPGCTWACPMRPAARRPRPSRAPASRCEADLAIKALGFDPEDLPEALRRAGAQGHPLGHDRHRLQDHDDPPLDGVFAAGDIVRGASLVVWAVRDGRDAAPTRSQEHPRPRRRRNRPRPWRRNRAVKRPARFGRPAVAVVNHDRTCMTQ